MKHNILLLLLLFAFAVQAQQITYYSCDFENAQVNSQWVKNPGQPHILADVKNKWYIGSAVNNGGDSCLYISANGGDSAYYVNSSGCAVAYVELDLKEGTYILSFDWRASGWQLDDVDGLYVCWVPNKAKDWDDEGNEIEVDVPVNTSSNSAVPKYAREYAFQLDNMYYRDYLRGSSFWKNKQLVFTADGKPHKLAFMWRNGTSVRNPGACIDNILVMSTELCPAPTNAIIEYVDETVKLTWSGDADAEYELRMYSYMTDTWTTLIVTDTTYTFPTIAEGYCDFYIRKKCGMDNLGNTIYSVPLQKTELIYILSRHCGLDYLTLTDENCYVAGRGAGFGESTRNVSFTHGVKDEGPESAISRHTVHKDMFEIDPVTQDATGYGLKTVPDGEIASVRLGNWCNGHEAERVEFNFHVDTLTNPMVILKYAVVIDYSTVHSRDVNPRFELQVLDSRHRPLDVEKCAYADFTFNDVTANDNWQEEGWHYMPQTGIPVPNSTDGTNPWYEKDIMWKDWTQVGINLSKYHNQDVIIQLSTYDCADTQHFGYAYFVLKCSKGELEGMSCGEVNPVFTAPDGFNYRWYLSSNAARIHDDKQPWDESLILGRDQEFKVDVTDTLNYSVDCMFVGDSTCSFPLRASSLARFPKAVVKHDIKRNDCQNKVIFTSDCHMVEENQVSKVVSRTAEQCESIKWKFDDGTTTSDAVVERLYPDEGGNFKVKLLAYYQTCSDSMEIELNIPPIGPTVDHIPAIGCIGTGHHVHYTGFPEVIDRYYYDTNIYKDTVTSSVGCDSVFVLDLKMVDRVETTVDTTILDNETYKYDSGSGMKIVNTAGVYTGYLRSAAGCDSIVTHNLYVHDRLMVSINPTIDACADQNTVVVPFTFTSGRTDTYSMTDTTGMFTNILEESLTPMPVTQREGEIEIDLPQPIAANYYPLLFTFYDDISGNVDVPVNIAVHYPDTILRQKWNDVLAIRDSMNNGGYNFIGFQWYKGTEKIEGATGPYLYLNGEEFDFDQTPYYVELTRSDSVVITTCPFYPEKHTDKTQFPSIVSAAARVPVRLPKEASIAVYDMMGRQHVLQTAGRGVSQFTAPSVSGIYIVNINYTDSSHEQYKMIVL